ncbi:unnamed protein product [marine sediment metagenome]|uniref:Uncharacterized protein n=1 Tax=marine sediment metagenome TaxID=412755 RepID=X0WI13_9ZZZZ
MANADNPRGLTPVMSGGNSSSVRIGWYYASVTTAIFKGDVVQVMATGRVKSCVTTGGNVYIRGVAGAYNAAGVTPSVKIPVYDDPNTVFTVNSDGTTDPTAATALADINATSVLIVTAGSTTTGQSIMELDYSQITTTTTHPLYIQGFSKTVDNDPALMHADYLVTLTRHVGKGGTLASI